MKIQTRLIYSWLVLWLRLIDASLSRDHRPKQTSVSLKRIDLISVTNLHCLGYYFEQETASRTLYLDLDIYQ
jgi:hypothetical protein